MNISEKKPLIELIESLEEHFEDILTIVKAIGNNKRLSILISLLTGEKTFDTLKREISLQKTALSNHLTILINTNLIEKPEHGKYRISPDGELFIRTIETAYKNSIVWEKKGIELLQRGEFSETFVYSFFGRS